MRERIMRSVAAMEDRLDRAGEGPGADLAAAASAAAWSRHHFHRAFRSITGLTPAGYMRARRLSRAAEAIAAGAPLAEAALDAGFAGQQAFTRAFRAEFGLTPGAVAKGARPTLRPPLAAKELEMKIDSKDLSIEIVERPEITVVGLAEDHDQETTAALGDLWMRAGARFGEIAATGAAYGVSIPRGEKRGDFRYVAGLAADPSAPLPEGMEKIALPGGKWARVRVPLSGGPVNAVVGAVYAHMFGEWLPKGDWEWSGAPDAEVYDERFDPATMKGEIDLIFHVVPKG